MPTNSKSDKRQPQQQQETDIAGAVEQLPEGRHGGLDSKIKRTKQGIRSDACIENDPDERGLEGSEAMPGDEEAGRD